MSGAAGNTSLNTRNEAGPTVRGARLLAEQWGPAGGGSLQIKRLRFLNSITTGIWGQILCCRLSKGGLCCVLYRLLAASVPIC